MTTPTSGQPMTRDAFIHKVSHLLSGNSFALIAGGHHEEVASKIYEFATRLSAAPAAGEPVAWQITHDACTSIITDPWVADFWRKAGLNVEPLIKHATPQEPPTVGEDSIRERAARIADPWPEGGDTDLDRAVVKVRKEIAASIRSMDGRLSDG